MAESVWLQLPRTCTMARRWLFTWMVSRRRTVGLPVKLTRSDQMEVSPLRQAFW